MRTKTSIHLLTGGISLLGLVVWMSTARAQDAVVNGPVSGQNKDWLKASSPETFQAISGQTLADPFAVLSSGSLWQEQYGGVYTRQLAETLTLSCETSTVTLGDDSEDLSRSQKTVFQFQPLEQLTLRGDLHDSISDASMPGESTTTSGAAFSAESHLPLNATLDLGLHSDRTSTAAPSGLETETNAYDAQIKQPIGQLPLSAVLKGHYEATSTGSGAPTSLPSLEQSLVWKPLQDTTLQMGLRQQQYQEYPGVDHLLNEALFADWSQKIVDDVSWHSYAEVLNSRGLLNQAPASPIATGSNGTAQATAPGSNASLTSSLPVSLDDQTVTFSTGPSFHLQKDISASVEYSNRWDKNPAPGSIGQEQRVSLSVKGTF
jgi:hypothetical protein